VKAPDVCTFSWQTGHSGTDMENTAFYQQNQMKFTNPFILAAVSFDEISTPKHVLFKTLERNTMKA
jgi:hypothetical protein